MSRGYRFAVESFRKTYPEFEPLYRQHYGEMCDWLRSEGMPAWPYNPRLDVFEGADRDGWLAHYTARTDDGAAVGYINAFVTPDMLSSQPAAHECGMYVLPKHRNGTGRRLTKFALDDLRSRGVLRFGVAARTDPRAAKQWARMGFRSVGPSMAYFF